MAVQVLDYQGFPTMQQDSNDGREVMSASLQSMQHLMSLLSQKQIHQTQDAYSHIPDVATSDLKKVITLLGRMGHARFRRAPLGSPSTSSPPARSPSTPLFRGSPAKDIDDSQVRFSPCHDATQLTDMHAEEAHSMHSNFTYRPCNNEGTADGDAHNANGHVDSHIACKNGRTEHVSHACNPCKKEQNADGSVYNATTTPHGLHVHGHARGREAATTQKDDPQACLAKPLYGRSYAELDQAALAPLRTQSSYVSSVSMEERGGTVSSGKPLFSSARPPLPPKKRQAPEKLEETSRKCHSSARCHCAHKRRKLHSRTVVRVSAVDTSSDIPDDGYSWSIYGQKLVEGSHYPRIYYKCSSVRGCPARKHVQRASQDTDVFTVTYGRKHMHPQIQKVPVSSE